MIHHHRINRTLADSCRHFQLKYKDRDEVKQRRHRHSRLRFEYAGRHDRCNCVRGIMKAIHEVKQQGQRNQEGEDVDADLEGMHVFFVLFSSIAIETLFFYCAEGRAHRHALRRTGVVEKETRDCRRLKRFRQ